MSADPAERVGELLRQANDPAAASEELLPLVYDELRAIARRRMTEERGAHTLQATALVHEAWMRLVGDQKLTWEARSRFYVAASEAMRRVLLDHARRRGAQKRGAGRQVELPENVDLGAEADLDRALALDEALTRLEQEDARAAEIVRLRFFAGLDVEEVAALLATSRRTVLREWAFARARLCELLEPRAT
jgi:RNA polymerase sigma factor (TIGR02999 family)